MKGDGSVYQVWRDTKTQRSVSVLSDCTISSISYHSFFQSKRKFRLLPHCRSHVLSLTLRLSHLHKLVLPQDQWEGISVLGIQNLCFHLGGSFLPCLIHLIFESFGFGNAGEEGQDKEFIFLVLASYFNVCVSVDVGCLSTILSNTCINVLIHVPEL